MHSGERSHDIPDVVNKKETAFSFVLYKILDVGTTAITTISNDRGNILQISCKTSLKKNEYRCVVQMHGLEHMRRFR